MQLHGWSSIWNVPTTSLMHSSAFTGCGSRSAYSIRLQYWATKSFTIPRRDTWDHSLVSLTYLVIIISKIEVSSRQPLGTPIVKSWKRSKILGKWRPVIWRLHGYRPAIAICDRCNVHSLKPKHVTWQFIRDVLLLLLRCTTGVEWTQTDQRWQ